jgi:hypothetical protein
MTILYAWLLADFVSGLIHWWEDRALVEGSRFKFLNRVRADNERHHLMPGHFLRITWWQNIETTLPFAFSLSVIIWAFGAPMLYVWTFFFLGFGNLIHRWAHEPREKRHPLIRLAQAVGLFISPYQHGEHHYLNHRLVSRNDSNKRFCVMSSWLNPTLDSLGFFNILETLFGKH